MFSDLQKKAVQIGNDAWWVLEFYSVGPDNKFADDPVARFSSADYFATIDAALPSNLEGGSYSMTIEGLVDVDYAKISQAITDPPAPIAAKLYLLWHDAISGPMSYLTNLAGLPIGTLTKEDLKDALVAVLAVTKVSRKLGSLTYDTEIQAVEWAHYATSFPLQDAVKADTYVDAAAAITKKTNVTVKTWPLGATVLTSDRPGAEKRDAPKGMTPAELLRGMAKAIEVYSKQGGRGMLLIRDGAIHLGARPYPLEAEPKDLTPATGLLQVVMDGTAEKDPSTPYLSGKNKRAQFTLLLKGRPDIKPGDVVRFDPATEDDAKTAPGIGAALAGAFAGSLLPSLDGGGTPSTSLAVTSVRHRLGKAVGFSSEVKGVVIVDSDHPWDIIADKGKSAPGGTTPAVDPGSDAAGAIDDHVRSWMTGLQTIDIGQVRGFQAVGTNPTSAQTETVWEGLQPDDQSANGAPRLPIDANHATRYDMPYASPFAWGKCGLVLPRYPGMRVVLGHRESLAEDAIDLGALWESGKGPDSKPGDYWLILPVDVPAAQREKLDDTATAKGHEDKVTQDLIDAEGNRIIELGSLTITVGKQQLQKAGKRAAPAPDSDSVTIRHNAGGSEIVMLQDGTIRIKGKGITIDAGTGDLAINAANVKVRVTGTMDVS